MKCVHHIKGLWLFFDELSLYAFLYSQRYVQKEGSNLNHRREGEREMTFPNVVPKKD